MSKTHVNFFWCGNDFSFLENIVVKSHLKVGHEPIIWLSGDAPTSTYWKEIAKNVTIKNADSIHDVSQLKSKGNPRRASSNLWRTSFLYNFGGLYCDLDVFALKKFPADEWIVCSGEHEPELLSTAIIKSPPHNEIFLECLQNFKEGWGNVTVFSIAYRNHFGHSKSTHEDILFYPYKWRESNKLFSKMEIPPGCYSIHLWIKALEDEIDRSSKKKFSFLHHNKVKETLDNYNEEWCEKNPDTLLGKLWNWLEQKSV